jgi:segregation and condensation protein A
MTHEVRLDVFEGPIDLLLHLITRQRVDIYEVSLSAITDEYLKAMGSLDPLDLETATGFLVVAATLLELKSARLLPQRGDEAADSQLLEERDLLLARLVECATFRDAGSWLKVALEKGLSWHPRSVPLETPFLGLTPDLELKVSVTDLTAAAVRALTPRPRLELDVTHVTPITASVKEALLEMVQLLRSEGRLSFRAMCGDGRERIDVVVRFLGLLELFKAGAVELSQVDRFGDITATWTHEVDAEQLLDDVDDYAIGEAKT